MRVLLYEGDPSDPLNQTMRVVRSKDLETARKEHPTAFSVQRYERPQFQHGIDVRDLQNPQSAWK